jgi:hypothetical protein
VFALIRFKNAQALETSHHQSFVNVQREISRENAQVETVHVKRYQHVINTKSIRTEILVFAQTNNGLWFARKQNWELSNADVLIWERNANQTNKLITTHVGATERITHGNAKMESVFVHQNQIARLEFVLAELHVFAREDQPLILRMKILKRKESLDNTDGRTASHLIQRTHVHLVHAFASPLNVTTLVASGNTFASVLV